MICPICLNNTCITKCCIFFNETLNHFEYYFDGSYIIRDSSKNIQCVVGKKNGTIVSKYNQNGFVNILNEENIIYRDKLLYINKNDIMKFLNKIINMKAFL